MRAFPRCADTAPLALAGDYLTAADAAATARARVARLSTMKPPPKTCALLASWIDAHFAVIRAGEITPLAPPNPKIYPEHMESHVNVLSKRWVAEVSEAMLPPAGKTSAVSKLFRKGLPVPSSLRYIGQQMQQACAVPRPDGNNKALRDICVASARGTWDSSPPLDWKLRYRRWKLPPSELYARYLRRLKPAEIRVCIVNFVRGVAEFDPLLHFMRDRNIVSYYHCVTMNNILTKLARPQLTRKRKATHVGFGINVPVADFENASYAVSYRGSAPPSAKRIRAALHVTPGLAEAVYAHNSPHYGHAALLTRQDHLSTTWACRCTGTCGWLKRPIGIKTHDVVIDLDAVTPRCGNCDMPAVAMRVNGNQLNYGKGKWARLCNKCGVFTTKLKFQREFAVCGKCFDRRL